MKKLNLNSTIKFRLNDYGKELYYHRHDDLINRMKERGCKPIDRRFPAVDENGYTSFQLWEFMSIYGKHSGMGCPEFWQDLNIYIDEDDLDTVDIESNDHIKPCPFCGGEAEFVETTECWGHGDYHKATYVTCKRCGSKGPTVCDMDIYEGYADNFDDAKKQWNWRT